MKRTGSFSLIEKNPSMQTPIGPSISLWLGMTLFYALSHLVWMENNRITFFFTEGPKLWIEWAYWSGSGTILSWISTQLSTQRDSRVNQIEQGFPFWSTLIELLKRILLVLITLAIIAYGIRFDVPGAAVQLPQSPFYSVLLAFVLGYFAEVAQKQLSISLLPLFRRFKERHLERHANASEDATGYVQLHVDPRLAVAYWKASSTMNGKPGHSASMENRVGYAVTKFLSGVGFTVNALKMVFIAQDILERKDDVLVEIVAHEASHAAQGFWSDSLEQERTAYKTAARVMEDLKARGEASFGDRSGWLRMDDDAAEERVKKMGEHVHLYGEIPKKQPTGWADKIAMIRQAGFLIRDFINGRNA